MSLFENIIFVPSSNTGTLYLLQMVDVLEITPTPIEQTLCDMAYALIDLNLVPKSKKYKQVGVVKIACQ